MADEIILKTHGTSKHFGGLAAVNKVDMDIRQGEILGLIGPNGAGKTTLVNIITGMLPITEGRVTFREQDISDWPPYKVGRTGIARTFQIAKPFRNMTVKENVAVGAMYGHGGAGRNARQSLEKAEEVLEFVGLQDSMDKGADQLTLPALKRLEIAKALAMEPELLFLDEAMAGLNLREIESAMELVRKINEMGITLLVIEHVMKAIVGVCERVIVLDFGEKIAEGTPQEVMGNPKVIEAYLGEKFARRMQEEAAHAQG